MSLRRLRATFSVEFWRTFRRPLFIVLATMLLLSAFGLSSGKMSISSGDSSVGGTKAWITSEFAQTQMMTFIVLLYYSFFIAIGAGMTLLRDRETKVDVLLHSTPLTAGEYVWGRFFAITCGFIVLMVWQVAVTALFNHAIPNASALEIRGPFRIMNYLTPVLTIGLPFLIFYAGLSMFLGEKSRSPVLVFLLPIASLLIFGFFLWTWAPSWLDPRVNKLFQLIDPAGYRWLNETHLKVDRGVQFYNTQPVPYDALFWLNRAWMIVVGFGAVLLAQRSVALSLRGEIAPKAKGGVQEQPPTTRTWEEAPAVASVRALGMKNGVPSFLGGAISVARAELKELLRQPGLYIFVPIILVQGLANTLLAVGMFDTPILLTPGTTAVGISNQISALVCFMLMFYTVESLERERTTGFSQILYATPLRTAALLSGKALANSAVATVVLLASLAGCAISLTVQHTVPFSFGPYVLIWGLLLIPTFFAWTAFVTAVYSAVGNRYAAYAVALAALAYTGFRALTGQVSWAGNWALWRALRWSDLGFFETDRVALVLNRVMVLGLAVLFIVLAVRLFGRRGADAVRTMHRLAPRRLTSSAIKLAPFAMVPLIAWMILIFQVSQGMEGGAAKKARKDYWAKNLKTWLDAPLPDIARADVKLKLDPARHWLASEGSLTLVNGLDVPLTQIPLTGGLDWEHLAWTMNGRPVTPEDSRHLYLFTPPAPLATGDSVVIGWKWDGRFPNGVTKNGGNTSEFVLPSGVVLTGFTPSFVPVVGFMEDLGETKENRTEPRRYPRDYWKGVTRATYGATAWFPARVSVTAPAEYALNSVGICVSDSVKNGWRTQVWATDHPVKILNVVCGRWKVKQGKGTTIFYSSAHPYNIDEMSSTLDAARHWYSEWFLPYPWRELKLSEFPALAGYAQGFGTNITFSENIGFLTKNDAKTDATFLVTAHEAAHQWWGNILTPAKGPNGDFLSEGMAHFSTLLLFDKMKGPRGRMEFAKSLEARYNDRRRVDDERAMYDVDGKREADETVIYDRGGWVFWMLYDFMGHDRALAGYQHFIRTWSVGRDHPALQDFVASMRPYAADAAAYDAFVKEWMEDRVVPEYRVVSAKKAKAGNEYDVTVTVRNTGTGSMPVEVAAAAGERWAEPKPKAPEARSAQNPSYREARGTVTLGTGESRTLTIRCGFVPERVVVDPDARILQLRRKQAVATL
ncbi:MAG TPA: M1 family aminopeptidase [Candidatus Eisenbacteria bacterium]|nr:M1 family aminopeptidase [Candidatus Eisenbacteria bacterium]